MGVVVFASSPCSVDFGEPKMGRKGRTERTICLGLIKLNNVLPAEIGLFWLTPKEIHERLIYGGVDRSLKLSSVDKALKNYNKGEEHLKKSEYGGKSYFRSTLVHLNDAHNACPLIQRFKWKAGPQNRLFYYPSQDYFKEKFHYELRIMNDALDKLEEEEMDAHERAKKEEEDAREIAKSEFSK